MPYGIVNTDTVRDSSGGILAPISSVFRNRIINGAMVIDQRNAGASVTIASGNTYTLDRWYVQAVASSKFSVQQNAGSVTPPVGFSNYLGITSLAATSSSSTDYYSLVQAIEGYNFADLQWGTANAKTVTVSFQVRSSLTGTFSAALSNGTYSYPFTYTISAANTWTSISVTIAGSTAGTWATTNTSAVSVRFDLGMGSTYQSTANSWQAGNYYGVTGSVSVVATNGATLYITGVQLEVGSSATGFEYVNYQTSLANCQRYYLQYVKGNNQSIAIGTYYSAGGVFSVVQFPVTMRATPTLSATTGTDYYIIYRNGASDGFNSLSFDGYQHTNGAVLKNETEVSGTAGQSGFIIASNSSAALGFQAEL